ncbi:MAG: NRDE family protein [Ferruginibacter sp.]
MCTVSFISAGNKKIITSNRDENVQRGKASAPDFEILNNKKIIFPKDSKAGGTWFAAADNGVIAVLLNGAFVKHVPAPPYRKSRGLILLEIIESDNPLSFYAVMSLQNIEPFTLVLYQQGTLHELRWDGNSKHELLLNNSGNYIWSSATLYTDEIIQHRKNLFDKFVDNTATITADLIYQFHSNNNEDDENGFVINRQTGLKTFSITQAVLQNETVDFLHTDLLQHQKFEQSMIISNALINS